MNETTEFWKGDFGNDYTKRNRVNWRARIPFWDRIVQITGIRSAFEVGANAGWNLSAIKHAISGYNVNVAGSDLNHEAVLQARYTGLQVHQTGPFGDFTGAAAIDCDSNSIELVFTSGVLIHIPPDELPLMMQAIVDASCDYVLAIEYDAEVEEEVEYRGHTGKLWKRPYGKLYEAMGLTLVETGILGAQDGFDPNGVTYWLLRK